MFIHVYPISQSHYLHLFTVFHRYLMVLNIYRSEDPGFIASMDIMQMWSAQGG